LQSYLDLGGSVKIAAGSGSEGGDVTVETGMRMAANAEGGRLVMTAADRFVVRQISKILRHTDNLKQIVVQHSTCDCEGVHLWIEFRPDFVDNRHVPASLKWQHFGVNGRQQFARRSRRRDTQSWARHWYVFQGCH
jgi:hypothetical protein